MKTEAMKFGPRRGVFVNAQEELRAGKPPLSAQELTHFETFDAVYRALVAVLFNYVPLSGHPGGSISSGRFVSSLMFSTMDYDLSNPDRPEADILSYAAGHKALGLYGLSALRNEMARIAAPKLLAKNPNQQFRLEDLLGFRQNPIKKTPLFTEYKSKALDGHPTPMTPFVKLSTGASGVGDASSIGLAYAAADYYGTAAPKVHIVEGEGGMTPGRVMEVAAAAGTASLSNAILHLDWNQASIDSNRVCRDGDQWGDYVQWDPKEYFYLNDWNVIFVPDGFDFQQILTAQKLALSMPNSQPTAIVYRTTKGWQYGIEGKASHGAGHKMCSEAFLKAVEPLLKLTGSDIPRCNEDAQRCNSGMDAVTMERCYWDALGVVRKALETKREVSTQMAQRLEAARERLDKLGRKPREGAPRIEAVYELANAQPRGDEFLKPGGSTTLRGELGRILNVYNKKSGGAFLVASADLLGSTSVNVIAESFPAGYYNAKTNPLSRVLSIGGICEDGMAGVFSGLCAFDRHIGVASSYGAFLAPLAHIPARLHAIGQQSRQMATGDPFDPMILICAHAGMKTGEDGPTHADPQALQMMQENFPKGTSITLTPWEPQEIGTLVAVALAKRPALIVPYVTRPPELLLDRVKLGLAPASAASTGVYLLRAAKGKGDGSVVLQESSVTYEFVQKTLPLLEKAGIDLNVYYVASAELFDLLPAKDQERIFPAKAASEAMGITGFTLATMYRWVRSTKGLEATMHPFGHGHYLGSGQGDKVVAEAGLDGESQFKTIKKFLGR
jgi:transketolase